MQWAELPADRCRLSSLLLFKPPAARVRGLRSVPAGLQHPDAFASDGGGSGDLARCLELLRTLGSTAVDDAALLELPRGRGLR